MARSTAINLDDEMELDADYLAAERRQKTGNPYDGDGAVRELVTDGLAAARVRRRNERYGAVKRGFDSATPEQQAQVLQILGVDADQGGQR